MTALLLVAACNEPYDPIGPNKPAPVLLISPLEHGFDGAGGMSVSDVSTNAEVINIESAPDWVEAVVSEDNTSISVKAASNSTGTIRRGVVKLLCASGDNTATQYMKIVQAQNGGKIFFQPFSGKTLPADMTAEDQNQLATGNGYLAFTASGAPGYLYGTKQLFRPERAFTCTVDIRMNGGEGGMKLFTHGDNSTELLEIYLGYNATRNTGGIWVRNGEGHWLAMDDGTIGGMEGGPGTGAVPGDQSEAVYLIPDAAERDDWWRLSVTHPANSGDYTVTMRSLKTFNGETSELLCHYGRTFHAVSCAQGAFSLWARNFESQFRNFTISYIE